MSEAARKTYFHFTPTPTPSKRGEWRSTPPDSPGIYWVIGPSGDNEPTHFAVVGYEPDPGRVRPAGWELAEGDAAAPTIALSEIRAWWSERLEPPVLPKDFDSSR